MGNELKLKYEGMILNPLTGENMKEERNNVNLTPFKIIEYNKKDDVKIEFLDDNHYIMEKCDIRNLVRNSIRNPFQISVYGKGFLGADFKKYNTYIDGKDSVSYKKWIDMIKRCYDEKSLEKRPSYKECKVYEKWLNYSMFAEWMSKRYYTLGNEEMHLDKDILYKNNKIYSPKRCVIVPKSINDLIVVPKTKELPVGITEKKNKNSVTFKARVRYTFNGKFKCMEKTFKSINDAMNFYETEKKKVIINSAEYYKELFIKEYGKDSFNNNDFKFKRLYNALYNYKIY